MNISIRCLLIVLAMTSPSYAADTDMAGAIIAELAADKASVVRLTGGYQANVIMADQRSV